jgi:hypothetical protein
MALQLLDSSVEDPAYVPQVEYRMSPSVSPQGLPVYAEKMACAYALATSDDSPVSP